jgi:serine/threonine protein kinase
MDDHAFEDVIRSIAAGTPVDWDTIGTSPADVSVADVLSQLRLIARIAEVHGTGNSAASDAYRADMVGRRWGPLNVIDRIGRGAYADVYRARDTRLDREVALKLLVGNANEERAVAIIEEARLLAKLLHPNVATVFGAERLDGFIGIWMEFVSGKDLEELLRERGPLDPRQVCEIGVQLCSALAAVHRAGVLHRDIKATNVRCTDEGRVVLLDFGSGRDLFEAATPDGLVGTPLYLAPELLEGSPASVQSDVYSVGVLLYHLLTGSYPIQGKTVADLRKGHASTHPTPVRSAKPGTPRRIAAVIDRAISKVAHARFSSAEELESALRSARAFPRRMAMVAGTVTLTASTALAAWFMAPPGGWFTRISAPATPWLTGRQLNWSINWSQMGAPSPDGRLLSYADGTGNLVLMDLQTGERQMVTSAARGQEEYATQSVFSPDSRRIAYSWFQQKCACQRVRIDDLTTRASQTLPLDDTISSVRLFDWSHDGAFLLASITPKVGGTILETVSAIDGRRRVLKSSVAPGAAAFSPDDRFIVYDVAGRPGQPRDVHVLDLATLVGNPLVAGSDDEGEPIWVDDEVLFASNRNGKRALWRVGVLDGRATEPPRLLTDIIEPGYWRLGLTTGGSLYYGASQGASAVYTADVSRNDVSIPSRASAALESEVSPEWSPDSRTLVWVAGWGLQPTLRFREITTGRERDVTTPFAVGQNPRWSQAGTTMLVRGADERGPALRLIDVATGQQRAEYLRGRTFGDAEWLPDGNGAIYIDFQQNLIGRLDIPSGVDRVVHRLPDGQILGRGVALSPDGRSIAMHVFERKESSIRVITLEGGQSRTLLTLRPPDSLLLQEWTSNGRAVLFTRSRQIPSVVAAQEWQLWSIDVDGGEPRYLNLSMADLTGVRPSPDGRHLVFTSSDARNRIRVLDNVLTALRSSR